MSHKASRNCIVLQPCASTLAEGLWPSLPGTVRRPLNLWGVKLSVQQEENVTGRNAVYFGQRTARILLLPRLYLLWRFPCSLLTFQKRPRRDTTEVRHVGRLRVCQLLVANT